MRASALTGEETAAVAAKLLGFTNPTVLGSIRHLIASGGWNCYGEQGNIRCQHWTSHALLVALVLAARALRGQSDAAILGWVLAGHPDITG